MKHNVFNTDKYTDIEADLMIAQAEIKALKSEIKAACARIAELEAQKYGDDK